MVKDGHYGYGHSECMGSVETRSGALLRAFQMGHDTDLIQVLQRHCHPRAQAFSLPLSPATCLSTRLLCLIITESAGSLRVEIVFLVHLDSGHHNGVLFPG